MDRELRRVRKALRRYRKLERRINRGASASHAAASRGPARVGFLAAGLLLFLLLIPPFLYPVDGPVSSGFFLRRKPDRVLFVDFELHRGLDIAAAHGAPVRAARSGVVIEAASSPTLGNYLVLRHPLGFTTLYAHLSRSLVSDGALVWRGRRIGAVGSTGRATGPHLHFEVRAGALHLPPGLVLLPHDLRRTLIGR